MALLGKLLLDRGVLTEEQLQEALEAQNRLTAQGMEKLLGDLLIAKGYATPQQIREVLEEQQKQVVVCGACRVQFNVGLGDVGAVVECPRCMRQVRVPEVLKEFNIAVPLEPTYIGPGPAPVAYLVVKRYDADDEIFPIREGDRLVAGSAPGTPILLEDEGVEPEHAVFQVVQGALFLTAMAKQEGVYVNGRKVSKCSLRIGDLVLLGHSPIMVSAGIPSSRGGLYGEGGRENLLDQDPTMLVGSVLGSFRFVKLLGIGGMAVVLLAEHVRLNRPVAVKVLKKEMLPNRKAADRFIREALAGARLNHPNIVQIYDAGHLGGLLFISMEYVEGEDMGMCVKRLGKLPVSVVLTISVQAAMAMQFAHEAGVIHRDIKPSNIMLTKDGRVKMLDLGIARVFHDAAPESRKVGIGTLVYMSPEQTQDAATVDHRADIYSLGATMYKLLTGQPPFKMKSVEGMVKAIRRDPVPDPRVYTPELSDELVEVLYIAMAKKPENRFQTMKEFQEELIRVWDLLRSD